MRKGIQHILAATVLVSLSACASDYVSGYDEIRQRTAAQQARKAQPPARPAENRTRASGKSKKAAQTAHRTPAQKTASRPAAPPVAERHVLSVRGGSVTVGPGETLFAISRRTGVELRDLVVANNLEPPYALRAGQRLTIPAARYHVVQKGETGYSISRAYGTDLTTLARLNNLTKPYAVQVGQRLRLPSVPDQTDGGQRPATAIARAPATQATASSQTAARAAPAQSQPSRPLPEPGAFAGSFSWPLTGRILSSFGPKQGGLHNDGINIAATKGATVRAAASGVVAYAGDGLKGFGWLILIKHGDGWVTAYGHNEAVLVKRGDTVRAGEPIARAGSTGSVDRPQLHFEIRRGRRAVNPLQHLPKSPVS
ncbi:peptidoglycan DD-metalloendopeptidase family protein [Pedomonas mirosovicensis]|uniref:peptidoglycan DD-metalloendopeptidase family protein n=1 Tax=Pedomonas mirosovicensis TaxID=2908641 RepID=UPI0021679B70|nr:peptidoglycan DD-metalloendopeptidase family protein [Pedomonas mirosovicensis]MCH8685537.1 peptidoglycan DD-metalloendopeptidase family protein [Pedomonas mirosovicensis]